MYIWILLATIMVALAFFNVSPRADKENAVNEVKASLIINRFRAEHLAMARTMDCEIIRRLNNTGWRDVETENPYDMVSVIPKNIALPYTRYKCNLPMGYVEDSAILNVHHMIICLKKRIEDPDQEGNLPVNCSSARFRYMVSYAAIPDRWLSKDPKDLERYGVARPLPILVSLMAKASSYGCIYGWADCAEGSGSKIECDLRGYNARVIGFKDIVSSASESSSESSLELTEPSLEPLEPSESAETVGKSNPIQKMITYTAINRSAALWNATDFKTLCNSAKPCLVAYERFPTSDKAHHCQNLIKLENPNCTR